MLLFTMEDIPATWHVEVALSAPDNGDVRPLSHQFFHVCSVRPCPLSGATVEMLLGYIKVRI